MRKETTITLNDRGKELTFKVREMPASRLESWIIRAGLLLAGSGLLDHTPQGAGEALEVAGRTFHEKGLTALQAVDYEKGRPLLDELMACCTRIDAGIEQQLQPEIVDGIIEDVRTRFALYKAAWEVNMGFLFDAAQSATEAGQVSASPAQSKRKISVG